MLCFVQNPTENDNGAPPVHENTIYDADLDQEGLSFYDIPKTHRGPVEILMRLKKFVAVNIADQAISGGKKKTQTVTLDEAGLPTDLKSTLRDLGIVSIKKLVPSTSLLTSAKQSLVLTLHANINHQDARDIVATLRQIPLIKSISVLDNDDRKQNWDSLQGENLLPLMYHLGDPSEVGYCESSGCGLAIESDLGAAGNINWLAAIENYGYGAANPTVAVADSGIDYDHPDLQNQLWTNPDCLALGYDENNWWECDAGFYGLNAYPTHALERAWGTCTASSPLAQEYAVQGYDYLPTCRRPRSSNGDQFCTHYCNDCGADVFDLDDDNDPCVPLEALSDFDVMDNAGHGSFVAGAIAANSENQFGMPGPCPKCKVMSLKYTTSSSHLTLSGIEYALQNDAKIINMSFGKKWFNFPETHPIWTAYAEALEAGTLQSVFDRNFDEEGNPIYSAFVQSLGTGFEDFVGAVHDAIDAGVLIFASAGNRGSSYDDNGEILGNLDMYPYAPCMIPGVICVANVDWGGTKASSSSFGDAVDISAPGELLLGARATRNGMIDRCQPSENGDVDFNDEINVLDAVIMVQFVLENMGTGELLANGDVNGDGMVNVMDVIVIIDWIQFYHNEYEEELEEVSAPIMSSPLTCRRFNEFGEKDITGIYGLASGTSFSTPVVAGVAGLILSHFPCLNADEVKGLILNTTNNSFYELNGDFTNKLGNGVVDAYAALDQAYELYGDYCGGS